MLPIAHARSAATASTPTCRVCVSVRTLKRWRRGHRLHDARLMLMRLPYGLWSVGQVVFIRNCLDSPEAFQISLTFVGIDAGTFTPLAWSAIRPFSCHTAPANACRFRAVSSGERLRAMTG